MIEPARALVAADLVTRTFRASRRFALRSFETLDAAQRDALVDLGDDDDFYGFLVPVDDPRLGTKSVDCDTALLWLSLVEAGPLPHFVQSRPGGGRAEIAQLVLDGVLEIAAASGDFVSGPAARSLVYRHAVAAEPSEDAATLDGDRLGSLSRRALRYAQNLGLDDVARLSARLYAYNTVPATPRRRRSSDPDAVARRLGLATGGAVEAILRESYREPAEGDGTWRHFAARHQTVGERDEDVAGTPKLYVSPHPDVLGDVLPSIVETFRDHGVPQFKIGRDGPALWRPDKVIAYLPNRRALDELGASLAHRLDGWPAQGVPFTAPMSSDGMISWGLDPEGDAAVEGWQGRESWRLWIVRRLAWALVRARSAQHPDSESAREPWRFALDRLRLDGVDTRRWTPAAVTS